MPDVTILLEYDGRMVEVSADSLDQAKRKIGIAWPTLFAEGPQREAATFEVVMTEIADSYGEAR